jgi:hypothetical protein
MEALLVFCEGPHDVAFIQQALKICLNFEKVTWKFSEYPSPFNSLFKTSVKNHAADDLSLDMAHKFFLPDSVWKKDEVLILVFNTGGKSQTEKVKSLLKSFLTLLEQAKTFPENSASIITQAKYLFLYDADHIGTAALFNEIKQSFSIIEDENSWSFDDWIFLNKHPFGAVSGDKAAYIWCTNPENGTLEDMILPMLEKDQENLIEKVTGFVDSGIFVWETEHKKLKNRFSEIAARKKAIITCAGQREKTGSSMNVIIGQAKLISEDTFLSNASVKAFVTFIEQFLGV